MITRAKFAMGLCMLPSKRPRRISLEGTSAIAAIAEKRHYLGIDKEEKYVALSEKNIDSFVNQKVQLSMFDME